jgi:hypothetical protein
MAVRRQVRLRPVVTRLVRIIVVLPLAAFWATLSLSMLAAIVYGWYAAIALLLRVL